MLPLRVLLAMLVIPASCELCSANNEKPTCDTACDGDTDTDTDTDTDADTGPPPDTAEACETTDPQVPDGFVSPEGWYLELFAEGFELPGAVQAPGDGAVYLGAGEGTWDERAVHRILADGTVDASDPISDPDGIALDSAGQLFAAGSNHIVLVESLDGGSDSTWHSLSSSGNINGLVIDSASGDIAYVPLNDGRVFRVDQDHTETVLTGTGDEAAVALDAAGDLWVVRRNNGGVQRIDKDSLEVVEALQLTDLVPGWVRTNRATVGPDGLLYFTAYVTDQGASVRRWDPADPGTMETWLAGIQDEDNDPDDLDFSAADGCLYWSAPLTGRIWRACPCP